MHYCGAVPAGGFLQLVMLEELRRPEPPILLAAVFFEPGSAEQLATELTALGDFVLAIGAPATSPGEGRACDQLLLARGVAPAAPDAEAQRLAVELAPLGHFRAPDHGSEGRVPDDAFQESRVFETNPDAVFCALRGRRLPAKRHPHGIGMRIAELLDEQLLDDGGDLWQRRIEEIDAAGAALCAYRYAAGHACWLGDPEEAVVVLPGATIPDEFTTQGVLAPVERLQLPPVSRQPESA